MSSNVDTEFTIANAISGRIPTITVCRAAEAGHVGERPAMNAPRRIFITSKAGDVDDDPLRPEPADLSVGRLEAVVRRCHSMRPWIVAIR